MHLVAGCVMEVSTMFCQKNILGHFYEFHGDYITTTNTTNLLTIMVSQILYLTQLISEIKNIANCCKQTSSTKKYGWGKNRTGFSVTFRTTEK